MAAVAPQPEHAAPVAEPPGAWRSPALGWPIVVSVVLHGLAVAAAVTWVNPSSLPVLPRIDVQLVASQRDSDSPAPTPMPGPAADPVPRPQPPSPEAREIERTPAPESAPVAAPRRPQPNRPPLMRPRQRPQPRAAVTTEAAAVGADGGQRAEPDLARIQLDLLAWLDRHKQYPVSARRRGVEGVVRLRFVVDRSGQLLEWELVQSSGSAHLDHAAGELLARASPFPALPAALPVDRLEVELPIEYRLRGDSGP